jgi:hypothetical protein
MMRTFLILALLASPALAEGPEFPLLGASYQVLTDVPGCDGQGEIAFQVDTSQTIPVWFYPEMTDSDLAVCTVTTRRGGDLVESVIPCEGADEAEVAGLVQRHAFCEARESLPGTSELQPHLTACLTVGRFEVLEGTWRLGSETEFGPYALSHDFDAGMVGLDFIGASEHARTDIYSVVATGSTSTPARLRTMVVPSDTIMLEKLPDVALRVASTVDLYLLDSSRASCLGDPGKCLEISSPRYLDDMLDDAENPALERILPYTALDDLGAQLDPGPFVTNAVSCDED